MSGATQPPEKVKDVRPIYPPMMIRAGVHGTVVVEGSIDRRGRVDGVRAVDSVPMLDQTTVDAVRQWRFDPATVSATEAPLSVRVFATFTPPR